MTLNQATFLVMAAIAVLGALGVVFLHSPVRAALALVVNFFVLGLLYFMLGTQMVGISQIMVYAGAIMVLFLFVIMVLKTDKDKEKPEFTGWKGIASIAGVVAAAMLIATQVALPWMDHTRLHRDSDYGRPQSIGYELFTTYVWPFEIISILLLVGIVGSIMLAKRRF